MRQERSIQVRTAEKRNTLLPGAKPGFIARGCGQGEQVISQVSTISMGSDRGVLAPFGTPCSCAPAYSRAWLIEYGIQPLNL
uniref:Uncharacterized protein n=2 Tax=Oryza sativa subsp. japonica TaxID=39947 RepID=Q10H81_ORYSJ|nr:hypothetical protein [Oryza sativa Japonica Group]AAO59988.1 hypothetical protein [Oryza sativa Japonica Group]ABF97463.1 hypothetical protein LOC_Os03g40120 [Oryza sativa Japonica Group]